MEMLSCRAILLLFILIDKAASRKRTFNIFRPAARYMFTNEDCLNGAFADLKAPQDGDRQLILASDSVDCDPSLGLRSSNATGNEDSFLIHSTATVKKLFQPAVTTHQGVTLELWFSVDDSKAAEYVTLLSFRDPEHPTVKPSFSVCDGGNVDFQVALNLVRQRLELVYRTAHWNTVPCHMVTIPFTKQHVGDKNALSHLVITLKDMQQRVWLNGKVLATLTEPFENDLGHWMNESTVQLLSLSSSDITLYQFTWYGIGSIKQRQIQQFMRRGFPGRIIQPSLNQQNSIIETFEDAEVEPGSHEPTWYESPQTSTTSDLQSFALPVQSFWTEYYLPFLRKQRLQPLTRGPTFHWYLTQLPDKGDLYIANETIPLAHPEDSMLLLPLRRHQLVYVPPPHAHSDGSSIFTSLSYCVSSKPIYRLFCPKTNQATLSIRVLPINDPPIATASDDLIRVQEGIPTIRIHLSGHDVDIDDWITAVQVTQQPTFGVLQHSVTSFAAEPELRRISHGTPLFDNVVEWTRSNSNSSAQVASTGIWVQYIWKPQQVSITLTQGGIRDAFRFRVRDRHGRWSADAPVHLQVHSALWLNTQATLLSPVETSEDTAVVVSSLWKPRDNSSMHEPRRLGFLIESTPDKGKLLVKLNNLGRLQSVEDGTTVEGSDDIFFKPPNNFCADKGLSLKVLFRVVAFNGEEVSSISDNVYTQPLRVYCQPNTSLTLSVASHEPLLVPAVTLQTVGMNESNVLSSQPSVLKLLPNLLCMIRGDRDQQQQKIKVTVLSKGFITFNEEYWNRTNPISGRRAESTGNISFMVYPDEINSVFSNWSYQSHVPGEDTVETLLEYGEACNTAAATTCLRENVTIHVWVDDESRDTHQRLAGSFPWQILLCLFGYPLVYGFAVAVELSFVYVDDVLYPKWIQHRADDNEMGMEYYYENTETGEVTWRAPIGEPCQMWSEDRDR